jgi:AraC-like DNA-binding protein
VFRTDDVLAADRFDYWRECMAKTVAPMDMSADRASEFRAEMRLLQFGAARVWPTSAVPVLFHRTSRLIRQSDPEFYHLSLSLHGTLGTSQAGREAAHGPYEMCVIDTSQPYDFEVLYGPNEGVGLEVPKELVPFPPDRVDRLLARRLPGGEGVGALLAGILTRLAQDSASYRPSDGPRLETVLIDLLSATLAHHLDADDRLPPETRSQALALRIRAFIQRHLHDPHLTPPAIAAAHHISASYLHRLFRAEGTTVSTWIHRQRLERARRDLANSALRHIPVHRIGARWGFVHSTAFSRAFRAAYGLPPGDYRRRTLSVVCPSRDCAPSVNDSGTRHEAF